MLSPWVLALMRDDLRELTPYDPAFSPCEVNLSANENTWPISASRTQALAKAFSGVALNRYPDPLATELRVALAAHLGVEPEQVLVCNGADEGLFNLLLAFAGPERQVLTAPPTFEEYKNFAGLVGAKVVECWRSEVSFALPFEELLQVAPTAALIFLCSPNNPTGDLVKAAFVERLLAATPGLVVVDEAYIDFAAPGSSVLSLVEHCPRLVVARTFSKAFSLAGARLGYLVAHPEVVRAVASVRQIYSVNALTQALGFAALAASGEVEALVAHIVAERGRLAERLQALGERLPIQVFPSQANFLLLRLPRAARVRARLRDEASILVRDFSYARGLHNCLRVSVGTPQEDDRFIKALAAILASELSQSAP